MRPAKPPSPLPFAVLVCLVASAVLAPAAGAQVAGYFGKNKITYDAFDWKIYHSPHFDLYYYEEEKELLPKIISFAESAYDRLSRQLDHQIDEPIPLIVYATHSAFEQNNIILNFIPEGTGAFASPVRNRMVMPADLPDPELFALLMHELTHIFEYHILFQGNLGKAIAQRPPTWMMEGFASYMAKDEDAWDRMWLRDAVVNDAIPPISRVDFGGYMAYRFGHAVFDFMEEEWGEEGVLDFIYELRSTIGARADRAIERAFRTEPEEFDTDFRRWLRDRYLPELVATGEPLDFGRPFRTDSPRGTWETSPAASPSGDLLAAFTTLDDRINVALFETRERRVVRNLTEGFTNEYQYLVAQNLVLGRKMGRDLAFSPGGDLVAVFAKREGGRSLVLIDVLSGGVHRLIDMDRMGLEQQLAPVFSPDGRKVAFSAWQDGDFDVFAYDLESDELTNLTDDDLYNGSPAYSPDGGTLAFTSSVGEAQKLFLLDLETGERHQLTRGDSNERDAVYSLDGSRLYFTSDRSGAENVYSADLETGELVQHTNVVTGAIMPAPFRGADGNERLAFTAFWKQRFRLYVADPEEALAGEAVAPTARPAPAPARERAEPPSAGDGPPRVGNGPDQETGEESETRQASAGEEPFIVLEGEPTRPEELPRFQPDIEVAIDERNQEDYRGFNLFLENAQSLVAVDSDQTVLGRLFLTFSDYVGDRRLLAQLTSVRSFSDFDVVYMDTSRRTNWMVRLYDDRDFFVRRNDRGEITRDGSYAETGLMGYAVYPFDFYRRVEAGLGVRYRDVSRPLFGQNRRTGELFQIYEPRSDVYPVVEVSLVEDTTQFREFGAVAGRRWRLTANYAPDLEESGTLSTDVTLDARQYIPLTRRSGFALRLWGGYSDGNFTRPYFIGGLDTLRGLRIYSELGDRAFYGNAEFRFPLIDAIATPWIQLRNIRGMFFLDVGGAYFHDVQEDWEFWNSEEDRLEDGLSSYGFGLSVELFGLQWNWNWAKFWDFDQTVSDTEVSFWVGNRF
ncbi:MAG: BamA/TamA family outer membrane protein [Thermoanaerobaculia bacterium]